MTTCPTEMVISEVGDSWTITRLNLEHKHALSRTNEIKFLKPHMNITEEEKTLTRTLNLINVPNRMIMVVLSYLRGGLSLVPYTKKDVSNFKTSIRKECGVNGAVLPIFCNGAVRICCSSNFKQTKIIE
uniref:FAR1 domain-containing protein n=1 Tax=Oryza brachyantha TaxID=4533 RepID=J3NCX7_ORYBR